jgi:hypothetical protein
MSRTPIASESLRYRIIAALTESSDPPHPLATKYTFHPIDSYGKESLLDTDQNDSDQNGSEFPWVALRKGGDWFLDLAHGTYFARKVKPDGLTGNNPQENTHWHLTYKPGARPEGHPDRVRPSYDDDDQPTRSTLQDLGIHASFNDLVIRAGDHHEGEISYPFDPDKWTDDSTAKDRKHQSVFGNYFLTRYFQPTRNYYSSFLGFDPYKGSYVPHVHWLQKIHDSIQKQSLSDSDFNQMARDHHQVLVQISGLGKMAAFRNRFKSPYRAPLGAKIPNTTVPYTKGKVVGFNTRDGTVVMAGITKDPKTSKELVVHRAVSGGRFSPSTISQSYASMSKQEVKAHALHINRMGRLGDHPLSQDFEGDTPPIMNGSDYIVHPYNENNPAHVALKRAGIHMYESLNAIYYGTLVENQ